MLLLSYDILRFVLCLALCPFFLVFFSPFSIAMTSLGEERANLSAFRTFVRFVLVWFCRFPLPLRSLGVWEGLRFAIVALPGLFSYLLFFTYVIFVLHMPLRAECEKTYIVTCAPTKTQTTLCTYQSDLGLCCAH